MIGRGESFVLRAADQPVPAFTTGLAEVNTRSEGRRRGQFSVSGGSKPELHTLIILNNSFLLRVVVEEDEDGEEEEEQAAEGACCGLSIKPSRAQRRPGITPFGASRVGEGSWRAKHQERGGRERGRWAGEDRPLSRQRTDCSQLR